MSSSNFGFRDAAEPRSGVTMTYIEAISNALREEMRRDPDVLVLGEDVGGSFGGAFKVTKGFAVEFGDRRVLNMPMTENGFIGAATGMAFMGLRPVVEVQFADFITSGFDAIVQFAATNHYRWGGAVPWVIRAPSDGGISSGPFHSQNPEAWFVHTPGLKVVAPATPADARGLLVAAIRDNNPVIYFESKPLYRSVSGEVPEDDGLVEIGKARVARPGATTAGVHRQPPSRGDAAAGHERCRLPAARESEGLEREQRGDGERVVDLHDVDILRSDPCGLEGSRARGDGARRSQVGHLAHTDVGARLAVPQNLDWGRGRALGTVAARHHNGSAAVGHQTDVESTER